MAGNEQGTAMRRADTVLTALAVAKLSPKSGCRIELRDALVPGFGVRVHESGGKSWCLLYTSPVTGKRRRLTIGLAAGPGALALETARQEATGSSRSSGKGSTL
jgi:hypothetical protein